MIAAEAAIRRAATATISVLQAFTETPRACSCVECIRSGSAVGGQYGNRIHREDLARLIVHCLLRMPARGTADAHRGDAYTTPPMRSSWLAIQLGVTPEG